MLIAIYRRKNGDSLPLLASAAAIIVIKSDVDSYMDVEEGYGSSCQWLLARSGLSSLTISFSLPDSKLKLLKGPNFTVALPGPKIYILTTACFNNRPLQHFCEPIGSFMHVIIDREGPTPRARVRDLNIKFVTCWALVKCGIQ
jgi:hypothetical protein